MKFAQICFIVIFLFNAARSRPQSDYYHPEPSIQIEKQELIEARDFETTDEILRKIDEVNRKYKKKENVTDKFLFQEDESKKKHAGFDKNQERIILEKIAEINKNHQRLILEKLSTNNKKEEEGKLLDNSTIISNKERIGRNSKLANDDNLNVSNRENRNKSLKSIEENYQRGSKIMNYFDAEGQPSLKHSKINVEWNLPKHHGEPSPKHPEIDYERILPKHRGQPSLRHPEINLPKHREADFDTSSNIKDAQPQTNFESNQKVIDLINKGVEAYKNMESQRASTVRTNLYKFDVNLGHSNKNTVRGNSDAVQFINNERSSYTKGKLVDDIAVINEQEKQEGKLEFLKNLGVDVNKLNIDVLKKILGLANRSDHPNNLPPTTNNPYRRYIKHEQMVSDNFLDDIAPEDDIPEKIMSGEIIQPTPIYYIPTMVPAMYYPYGYYQPLPVFYNMMEPIAEPPRSPKLLNDQKNKTRFFKPPNWMSNKFDNKNDAKNSTIIDADTEESEVENLNLDMEKGIFRPTTTKGGQLSNDNVGSGIFIHKLKVKKGGVAIAGPGGIATAGSGGTAIVGPNGYAFTHPDSLAIAGSGTKVVAVDPSINLADLISNNYNRTRNGSSPRVGKIVATGPVIYYNKGDTDPKTPVKITLLPFYGGAKGQTLQITETADGTVSTSIIQTSLSQVNPEESIFELEHPELPSRPSESDYSQNIKNIHEAALSILRLQEAAKKAALSEKEEVDYKEHVESLNQSANFLSKLYGGDEEDDENTGLAPWFARKKAATTKKDKKKEEEDKKKKEEEKKKKDEDVKKKKEKEKEKEEDKSDLIAHDDAVAINIPPDDTSVAEAKPVGLAVAGIGGVAASKPIATAVVGPGGLAIARPVGTAIAGVSPDQALVPIYAEGYIVSTKKDPKKTMHGTDYINKIISKYHQI